MVKNGSIEQVLDLLMEVDQIEKIIPFVDELVNEAKEWGGNIHPIECLNTNNNWCRDFAKYTFTQAEGSAQDKEDIEYKVDTKYYQKMPEQVMNKK